MYWRMRHRWCLSDKEKSLSDMLWKCMNFQDYSASFSNSIDRSIQDDTPKFPKGAVFLASKGASVFRPMKKEKGRFLY